jgi:hypothetical protein
MLTPLRCMIQILDRMKTKFPEKSNDAYNLGVVIYTA